MVRTRAQRAGAGLIETDPIRHRPQFASLSSRSALPFARPMLFASPSPTAAFVNRNFAPTDYSRIPPEKAEKPAK